MGAGQAQLHGVGGSGLGETQGAWTGVVLGGVTTGGAKVNFEVAIPPEPPPPATIPAVHLLAFIMTA